jgi:hypothetical protein
VGGPGRHTRLLARHVGNPDCWRAQNVTELGSGLVVADFFQNDRETGRKGSGVIDITDITDITVGGWT